MAILLFILQHTGHLNIVKYFTEELKCPPDTPGLSNMMLFQMARAANHPDVAQHLQEHSVIPYIYTAVGMMNDEQIKSLIGFNPSNIKIRKCISLQLAAMEGNMDTVKFLIVEKHCDPMCRDPLYQRTQLHVAALHGQIEVVKFFTLEMHCDPTSRDINSDSAL